MERISVKALRAGMGGPLLPSLNQTRIIYVVTAEHPDNSMRLSLAYRNPAGARVLPPCLTFEARSAPYSVVVMADAAIRGNIWEH
jgi:hypothetical protein